MTLPIAYESTANDAGLDGVLRPAYGASATPGVLMPAYGSPSAPDNRILLESGDSMLLETGDYILLEAA